MKAVKNIKMEETPKVSPSPSKTVLVYEVVAHRVEVTDEEYSALLRHNTMEGTSKDRVIWHRTTDRVANQVVEGGWNVPYHHVTSRCPGQVEEYPFRYGDHVVTGIAIEDGSHLVLVAEP